MVAFFFLFINCLNIILTTMRHLINKHYDTPGGLLGHPTNVSSHPKPPVSKEDETMKQTQDKWVFNFEENQLETQDGKVITVIDEHHGSLEDINLITSAPEMLDALRMAAIRIADLIYKMDGETVKKDGLTNIRGKNGEDELDEIYRLIAKAGGE